MRLYEIFLSGGPVMWPLLLCSIAVTTVVLERLFFWASLDRKRNRPLMDELLCLAQEGDWQTCKTKTEPCRDHVVRVLAVGILHRDFDMAKAMEAEANRMMQHMSRHMPILDTMITIAPLLGIFGTVLGIISSFKMLGAGGIADPKLVTAGIAQALITTATGLGIAIVAVIPYNYFNNRINNAIHVMEKYATNLEVVYSKVKGITEPEPYNTSLASNGAKKAPQNHLKTPGMLQ
ncbi:MotA/TolQ/ExbB proton channel family protein [Desulfogranum marinum]|uniref:MotA/TolQ/ExbB proton channel family protein n=1 Tax=Desulfogranum marinum TaxID=453220 RepID=UPI0029C7AECC|nr:MotA/TolQ/ExbB proton channel family protein [Desulfogranum marinum]